MVVYAYYLDDNRVQREAETIAAKDGYSVSVFSLRSLEANSTYRFNGVNVHELNVRKYRGKSFVNYIRSYIWFTLVALFACTGMLLRRSVDIVHIHNMPNFLIFSAIVPKLFGKTVILDVHDTMIETYAAKFNKNYFKPLIGILRIEEKVSCALANKIICVNDVQKREMVKRGQSESKITISMNVPDPAKITGKAKVEKSGVEKFSLVYHGTIAKRLGLDLTIKAVAMLVDKIPGLNFQVFGDGDDLDEFMELARRLRVEKYIHFNKRLPLTELTSLLKNMDLGIISNRKNIATELMLPVKMLEYMAIKVPVVAPELEAIEYYFNDKMVYFFVPDEVESLAAAIEKLYKDKDLREKQAQEAILFFDKFGWDKHKQNLIGLYDSL